MTPTHHPPEAELLEYSAGVTPEWLSLMWACHLTLCPRCRQELSLLEEVGGLLLPADAAASPARAAGPRRAARPRSAEAFRPRPLPPPLAQRVPWPVHRYVRDPEPRWQPLRPGMEHVPLTIDVNGIPVLLLRLEPGLRVERHEHAGVEWFMVLDGNIDDSLSGAHYHRGDVCWNEPGTVHHQTVGLDEPCIALVAMTKRFIPRPR